MIAADNDFEPVIYEQPFSSHMYENQSEFLHNYYTKLIHSTPTSQETNGINTTNQSNENDKTKCLNTNHIYQNIQKEKTQRKNLDNTISLRKSKKQRISTTRS